MKTFTIKPLEWRDLANRSLAESATHCFCVTDLTLTITSAAGGSQREVVSREHGKHLAEQWHREEMAKGLKPVEWRPISEAPRDGTVILVFGGIAHWHDGRWKTLTGTEYPGLEIQWPVTHWLPLPSPPKETT